MSASAINTARGEWMRWHAVGHVLVGLLACSALLAAGAQSAAARSTGNSASQRIAPRPPVVNLRACRPSPSCDYGPIYTSYPTYGNEYPADLGDCTFAAAAHWEQIVLGVVPDPTRLGYEFANAEGYAAELTQEAGLTQEQFLSYWQLRGIGEVYATGFWRFSTSPASTREAVREHRALIVELSFGHTAAFAQYEVSEGLHEVVVDGFTPRGPLVVSWGRTLQMSWRQWQGEAIGMWAVQASR